MYKREEEKVGFDITSYVMGTEAGAQKVVISGAVTCEDDGNGNITITED